MMENKLLLDILDLINKLKLYAECDDITIYSRFDGEAITFRFTWYEKNWTCEISFTKAKIEQVKADLITGTMDLINEKKRISGLF